MSDYEIDFSMTLIEYHGSAKDIILPNGISAIGMGTFAGNENITSVIFPETVIAIENYAFFGCTNLKSVTLPNTISEIGEGAFANTALTNIVIPKSIKNI